VGVFSFFFFSFSNGALVITASLRLVHHYFDSEPR